MGDMLINKSFVQSLLKRNKSLHYPYVELADEPVIEKQITCNFPQLSKTTVRECTTALLRYNAIQESIKLNRLLMELTIPYIGIEQNKKQREEMSLKSGEDEQNYLAYERSRIATMTHSILQKGCVKLADNGIVIVHCGANHVQGLTASLLHSKRSLAEKYDIQLFPIKLFSPYVIDGLEAHLEAEQRAKTNHTEEILQMYNQVPCTKIICKDTIEDSPGLKPILNNALAHAESKNEYTLDRPVHNRYSHFNYLPDRDLMILALVSRKTHSMVNTELAERKLAFQNKNSM